MVPPENRRPVSGHPTAEDYRALSLFFDFPCRDVSELLTPYVTGNRTLSSLYRIYTNTPLTSLQGEGLRLFHTGGLVPPYESSFLGRTGRGASALAEVSGFYRAWGLRVSRNHRDLADSISAELEFAAFLLLKVLHAEHRGWGARARRAADAYGIFLKDHAAAWIPDFCCYLRDKTRLEFYRRLATTTQRFLLREAGKENP